MTNTKIEWCDTTWNPVTGCLHGCEYCYARGIANRFGGKAEKGHNVYLELPMQKQDGAIDPYPFGFEPTFHHYRLSEPAKFKNPRTIFVGSMTDLFGEWVPDGWIREVFEACEAAPQHRYLFLTKNPQRYNDLLGEGLLLKKDNFWYGGTRTGIDSDRELEASMSGHTFLSIEPLHAPIGNSLGALECWDWIILGAETGNRKNKIIPRREWIEEIVDYCREAEVPVFMKNSLKPIWGENLITEFPW